MEPALCQLYRHTIVPYKPGKITNVLKRDKNVNHLPMQNNVMALHCDARQLLYIDVPCVCPIQQ